MMQIDLQCSALIGSAMAGIAHRKLASASKEWIADAHIAVLTFAGLVFAPVWLYLTLRWTPWESMYLWDLTTVPQLVVALFLPALSLCALGGFAMTHHLLIGKHGTLALAANALLAGSCALITWRGRAQAGFVGTLAEFDAGGRGNLLHSDLAIFFIIAGVLVFAPAAIITIRWLRS